MERNIRLALNEFPTVPESLRLKPSIDIPVRELTINLTNLFHQFYWDKYGARGPVPDLAHFEYLQFLEASSDFRFSGDGPGAYAGARRNISMEMGQAFCRNFLHDHLDIKFFAHISEIIERQQNTGPFAGTLVTKMGSGDTPDYLCTNSSSDLFLAEAKGRFSSINFSNKEFGTWREQFDRVEFKNSGGYLESLKGFIVATRFAIEAKGPKQSTIYAEDPNTRGELPMNERARRELAAAVTAVHYGRIAEKLAQPIMAASLRGGFRVPDEIGFPAVIWEFQMEPYRGKRFVGGYYPSSEGVRPIQTKEGQIEFLRSDPFRLDIGNGTFVGVQEHVFEQMARVARAGTSLLDVESPVAFIPPLYSAISTLKDGSIVGPVEFFQPVTQTRF
jgi:hypothetical protein